MRRTSFLVVDPATEQPFASVLATSPSQLDEAISKSIKAFQKLRLATREQISDSLYRIAQEMQLNKNRLALLETCSGKTLQDSLLDVDASIKVFKFYAGLANTVHGRHFSEYNQQYTIRKEPYGPVALLNSFNYPLLLMAWKMAPALAAGNTVIYKPSEEAPMSSLLMTDIVNRAMIPDTCSLVLGTAEIGKLLVQDSRIKRLSFTGSTETGKLIANQANLKHLTLELGGKNSIVVCASANIPAALDAVLDGAFSNAGQNCCACSNLLVHKSIYSEFIQKLLDRIKRFEFTTIHPSDPLATYSPLASKRHFDRIQSLVNSTVASSSAELVLGGKRMTSVGYFYHPTVFINVDHDHLLAKQEIFGPVLSVLKPFESIQEICNVESSYGLVSGIFSNDFSEIQQFTRDQNVGLVWVNCYNIIPPFLPLSGRKSSGIGHELGIESIHEFLQTKAVMSISH